MLHTCTVTLIALIVNVLWMKYAQVCIHNLGDSMINTVLRPFVAARIC